MSPGDDTLVYDFYHENKINVLVDFEASCYWCGVRVKKHIA